MTENSKETCGVCSTQGQLRDSRFEPSLLAEEELSSFVLGCSPTSQGIAHGWSIQVLCPRLAWDPS